MLSATKPGVTTHTSEVPVAPKISTVSAVCGPSHLRLSKRD